MSEEASRPQKRWRRRFYVSIAAIVLVAVLLLALDVDRDGLPTYAELLTTHTSPFVADTDGDGLPDGAEVNIYHTNPLVNDTDLDRLTDGSEVLRYHTDPLSADTDSDGLSDGAELAARTNPLSNDTDADGLSDREAFPLDPSRPVLGMQLESLTVAKTNGQPDAVVTYQIMADGQALDRSLVASASTVISRLPWDKFVLKINGEPVLSDTTALGEVRYQLHLSANFRLEADFSEQQLTKDYVVSSGAYTFAEVEAYWNGRSLPSGTVAYDQRGSAHRAFDDILTEVSVLAFVRNDLVNLGSKLVNYVNLLEHLWNDNATLDDVLFLVEEGVTSPSYVNTTKQLAARVYLELTQLKAYLASADFQRVATYPNVTAILAGTAWNSLIGYALTGDALSTAIDGILAAIERIEVEVGKQFFAWVKQHSPFAYQKSFAEGARWFLANLPWIQCAGFSGCPWGFLIGPWEGTGDAVAWLNARDAATTAYLNGAWSQTDYENFLSFYGSYIPLNYPYNPPTSLVPGTVHFYLPPCPILTPTSLCDAIDIPAYFVTRSMAISFITTRGLALRYFPPTPDEEASIPAYREIAGFFDQQVGNPQSLVFAEDLYPSQFVQALCNPFDTFEQVMKVTRVVQSFAGYLDFLDRLNSAVYTIS